MQAPHIIALKTSKKVPLKEIQRLHRLYEMDAILGSQVCGVDEVGRGSLAGPVVACACVVSKGLLIEGVNDSKQVPAYKRRHILKIAHEHKHIRYALGYVSSKQIDHINIVQATKLAMSQAIIRLQLQSEVIVVDGIDQLDNIMHHNLVQADSKSYVVALASMIAKEYRDELMRWWGGVYPEYGFEKHVGYGTAFHRKGLNDYGATALHRYSFAPVYEVSYGT